MKHIPFIMILLFVLSSCSENESIDQNSNPESEAAIPKMTDHSGGVFTTDNDWRLALQITDQEIPFRLTLQYNSDKELVGASVWNAEEVINLPDFTIKGDSLYLPFPIFDSEIRLEIKDEIMNGIWYNDARRNKNRLAIKGKQSHGGFNRFEETSEASSADFNGQWEVEFVYEEKDKSKAIGIFDQNGNRLKGTFRTETGDYRYLDGQVYGSEMKMSTFDGAHAFLFHAEKLEDGSLKGEFWSGDHWFESWTGIRNPDFTLGNPDSLTYMNAGETTLDFSFLNTKHQLISPSDPQFEGKPLLVQIMGTWCPNCKDETAWLNEAYSTYHPQGLEVISLAFELTTDTAIAFANINKIREHFEVPYEILFAGRAGRKTASAALPQLNHVMSYPTLIFMDKNHEVQRIYTGFNGPATGAVYEKLLESFSESLRLMLQPV